MKQSTVLPRITINGKEINCYEGDYIGLEGKQYTFVSQNNQILGNDGFINYHYLSIPPKDAERIDFEKLNNYHKSYRDGKLKNIKYFL